MLHSYLACTCGMGCILGLRQRYSFVFLLIAKVSVDIKSTLILLCFYVNVYKLLDTVIVELIVELYYKLLPILKLLVTLLAGDAL